MTAGRIVAALFLVGVLISAQTPSSYAQSSPFTVNARFPLQIEVFIPCANGGAGETVILSGILHDVFHVTEFADGTFFLKIHDQPQNIKGVGETTGAVYEATGVTQTRISSIGPTTTFINNFRIIGPGPGNNLLIQQLMHVTVNGKGEITAEFARARAECS